MAPAELIERPGGSEPALIDHVFVPAGPAGTLAVYAVPTVPDGRLFVVIVSVVARVNVNDLVALIAVFALSTAFTVTVAVAADELAVPLTIPVVPLRLSPAGSVPLLIDHVYGPVPPDAVSSAEYAVLLTKFGTELVIDSTVIESDFVTTTAGVSESCTCTVKFEVPVPVGVPLIVAPLSVSPAGSEPDAIDQLYGVDPPAAERPTE
jgi:hypothetical protein